MVTYRKSWLPLTLLVTSLLVLVLEPLLTRPTSLHRRELVEALVPAQLRLGELRGILAAEVVLASQPGMEEELATLRGLRAEAKAEVRRLVALVSRTPEATELEELGAAIEAMDSASAGEGFADLQPEYRAALVRLQALSAWLDGERAARREALLTADFHSDLLRWLMVLIAILSAGVAAKMNRDLETFFRRSERERRQKSTLLQSAGEGIVGVDAVGRITFANPMAARTLGSTAAEMVGRRVDEVLQPGIVALRPESLTLREAVAEVMRTGKGRLPEDLTLVRKDGSTFPAACGVFPFRDAEDAAVRGAVINFLDVTARHRAERERTRLLQAEKRARERAEQARGRARLLADASQLFADSLDYETTLCSLNQLVVPRLADVTIVYECDESGRIHRVRPGSIGRLPVELPDPVTGPVPHEPAAMTPPLRAALTEGRTARADGLTLAELCGGGAEGDGIVGAALGSVVIVPLRARGRILGALAAATPEPGRLDDADDVLLLEEIATRAALALDNAELYRASQQAVHARAEVLGIVSHDLRSPLNVVRLGAESLLRHGSLASGDAAERAQLEAIVRSADRMARMVCDLLDIARIDSRSLAIHPSPVPVVALAEEAAYSHAALAAEKGVRIQWEASSLLPPVMVDEQRILQVLSNLLGNAVRFTPAGGRVLVAADQSHEGEVCFRVVDTGCGIPAEHLTRLFDRFWRGDSDRRSVGLGLSIAKGIVESHGGRIWVESTVGVGSTFAFTVPVASARDVSRALDLSIPLRPRSAAPLREASDAIAV